MSNPEETSVLLSDVLVFLNELELQVMEHCEDNEEMRKSLKGLFFRLRQEHDFATNMSSVPLRPTERCVGCGVMTDNEQIKQTCSDCSRPLCDNLGCMCPCQR